MDKILVESYWQDIPVGRKKAATYTELMTQWSKTERQVRQILHMLSLYDNGDNYVLIRSSKSKGFYRTDDEKEIEAYRQECLNKGRSIFAPVKKCNRILKNKTAQMSMTNNLKAFRLSKEMTQTEVCKQMERIDPTFDESILSKMENDRSLPTPLQLAHQACIYECTASELINGTLYSEL